MSSILGLAIESLFFTNTWILIYTSILKLTDIYFPKAAPPEFIRSGAVPEPFEISTYLLLTFFFVVILFLIHLWLKKIEINQQTAKNIPIIRGIRGVIFLILTFLFLFNIGRYPMARESYPYSQRSPQFYNNYLTVYIITATFLFIQLNIYLSLLKSKRSKLLFIPLGLILLLIAALTFEPRFPMSGHDYSYFLGPVWEIMHGKTIYTQASSQYGFASILLLTILFKLKILEYFTLPVLIWLLYLLQYFLCFYLIGKITRSFTLALLGLFSVITVNYFSLYHLPATLPQIGPMRWLPLLFVLVFFQKNKGIINKKFLFFVAASSFWMIDSGIAIIFAYFFTLFILMLVRKIKISQFLKTFLLFIFYFLGIFLLINIVHLALSYQFINPLAVFEKLKEYGSSGFGMLPIDFNTHFWIVLLIYFASIIYFFKTTSKEAASESDLGGEFGRDSVSAQDSWSNYHKAYQEEQYSEIDSGKSKDRSEHLREGRIRQNLNQIILLSANLMLFASIYYVGRSHQHNLFSISIFPILTFLFLIGNHYGSLKSNLKIAVSAILFLLLIVYPAYQRQEVIAEMLQEKINRLSAGKIFSPELPGILHTLYPSEVSLINKNMTDKKIVILSADDTYLFYLTGKENLLYDNSQITILTQKDMDFSLQDVYKTCPKKIVIDCSFVGACQKSNPYVIGFFSIQPQLLTKINQACGYNYKPVKCTDQLCIAEGNKN